ncbi:hypothetical protein CAP36_00455 [Chitinophagaceae bacterium IBVUCB2]|nr:hypothetical protein CAP36_00455 [Chitinophagaceae bacterium IBVUCB2]
MRFKTGIAMATMIVFATSCGDSSTKTDTADSLTVDNNKMPDPAPVTATVVVPEGIKTSFKTKYPTVTNETWSSYQPIDAFEWDWTGWPTIDSSDYMVRFNQDGSEYWAWYNDGEWIGTVSPVTDFAGLPAAVNKTIQSTFPGYTIVSVDKESDKNRTAYEVELEKGGDKAKALIAENGSVLKKKTSIDGEKTKEKMNPKDSL